MHAIFSGEIAFNTDIIRQLRAHSQTNRKAFAYYFTNLIQYPPFVKPWYFPAWIKRSADHTDEVPFVFGAILAKDNYTALVNGEPDQFCRGRFEFEFGSVVWWVKYDTQVDTMMPYMMTSSVAHPLNFH